MKKWLTLCLLICVPLYLFVGCTVTGETQKQNMKVAVIAKSEASFFWQTVFRGVETAKNEYANVNIEIITMAPEREDDFEGQNELIKKAINEDKVNAIVVSASHYQESSAYIESALNQGIRVVTIDSGIWSDEYTIPYIGTDNYMAGTKAGEAMVSFIGTSGEVGVISFEENTGNGQERVQGLQDYLRANTEITISDIQYALSNEKDAYDKTKAMLGNYPNLGGIITFNEVTSLGVGDAIEEMDYANRVAVVGFDNNVRCITMLEKGVYDALIVQNPFAMGYLGLQSVVDGFISGKSIESIDTQTEIITKENMYDIDKQKLLFPLVG